MTLIRRLTYDLTGLPPTPEEVDAFLADRSPDAYERLVDRLLASPHYGEKWGRHWLDLVRYAETNGYERDSAKPFAWRYRDYVINAFNRDKPYDQFVREQLAGDEIDPASAEALIATGFYRLGIWDDEPADRPLARYDGLDGIVSTTGQVVLGMTINCARCHDHKVDPIPQRDYYRLLAFFQDVTHPDGKNLKKVADGNRVEDRRDVRRGARAWRKTHVLLRGNPEPDGRRGRAGRARGARATARHDVREWTGQAAGAGRLADRPAESADGPRDGQPALAVSFRPGHRADAQRLRQAGRAADASRAARLAGRRVRGRRLADQADAPADRAVERLPDVVAGDGGRAGRPTRPTTGSGGSRCAGSRPRKSATRSWRSAARSISRPAGPASIRRSRAR